MDKGLIWGVLALSGIAVFAVVVVGARRMRLTKEEKILWKTRVSRKSRLATYFHWTQWLVSFGYVFFAYTFIYRLFEPHILPEMLSNNFTLLEAMCVMACVIFLSGPMMGLLQGAVIVRIMRRILARIPPEDNRIEKGPPL